jgi:hypothetical protein
MSTAVRPASRIRADGAGARPLRPSTISMEQTAAAVAIFLLGLRQFLHSGATSGYAVAILLIPLWVSCLKRYRGARLLLGIGLLATLAGIVLSVYASGSFDINASDRTSSTVLLVGTLCGIGVVLWARGQLAVSTIGLWFGFGMLIGEALSADATSDNPWKFAYAVPVGIILLSFALRTGRRSVELAMLVILGGLSAAFDSRSYLATFLLAGMLVIWQLRPRTSSRGSWVWTIVLIAGIGVAVYFLGTTLLVNGYLGSAAQQRSVDQIRTAGSLILGGRPELAATVALLAHRFWGYGVGVVPTDNDVLVAKAGMAKLNYQPNNNYVEQFMFGGHIELHSTFGDLWANWGPLGLLLALTVLVQVVRAIAEQIASGAASALLLFLCFWTLWNIFFSPLFSADPTLILTMGLVLAARPGRGGSIAASGLRRRTAR